MSMVPHYLPEWALWAQLAATSLIASAATGGALYFGYWQQTIAREKLVHDLFDRRCKIYEKMHHVHMSMLARRSPLSMEEPINDLIKVVYQGPFLFGDELGKALQDDGARIWRSFKAFQIERSQGFAGGDLVATQSRYQAEIDTIETKWNLLLRDCADKLYLEDTRKYTLFRSRFWKKMLGS